MALDNRTLSNVIPLPSTPPPRAALDRIIGDSAAIDAVRCDILRFAHASAPVVIHGESGSGKELVAHALHACSARSTRRFVATNVGAICPELLGSELFGHVRGAFTGAVAPHRGLFEQAHGGTLFLDEIGELSLAAQVALLRALESGEIRPLGGEAAKRIEVRLVAATHRDLAAMVRDGQFRRDLYYRLHVLTIRVPPLRERKRDVPAIATALLARLADEVGARSLSGAALRLLAAYRWPGNVRQLLNVLRRVGAQTSERMIDEDHIACALMREEHTEHVPRGTSMLDETTMYAALRAANGKIATAARTLGVPRSTLRHRLKRLGTLSLASRTDTSEVPLNRCSAPDEARSAASEGGTRD